MRRQPGATYFDDLAEGAIFRLANHDLPLEEDSRHPEVYEKIKWDDGNRSYNYRRLDERPQKFAHLGIEAPVIPVGLYPPVQ